VAGIDGAQVNQLLERAAQGGAVPGAIAMAADRDGVTYSGAAGVLSVDGDQPARIDTMLRIASMTKPITSVAVLQLIEQRRLELEQTVASVLPEFGDLKVLEGFDGDRPRLREPRRPATIHHLLTHTSGLAYWFGNADMTRYHELTGTPTPLSFDRGFLAAPMIEDPGVRWEYGISTDWLGQVVEAISGQGLDAYFAEHVLGPLGMTDTTFTPSSAQRERMMALHARTPDGGLTLSDLDWPPDPGMWCGGHGLFSTPVDYLRLQRALLAGGELDGARVLEPESVDLAFSNQIGDIEPPTFLASAEPALSNDIHALPGIEQRWGLGFHLVMEDVPGARRAGTGDWSGLTNCYFWIDRASGVTAALYTQLLPFFDERMVELAMGFEQAVYAGAAVTTPA